MSAADHLQPQQFWHGSRRGPFKPGTLLTGGHPGNFGAGQEEKYIYFTSNPAIAADFAHAGMGPRHDPDRRPRLHTVETTGEYEPDPHEPESFRSEHPVRVLRSRYV